MRWAFTPTQVRQLEAFAFGRGVPSLLLMERAAASVTAALTRLIGGEARRRRVLFFCGTGNNGGDGLAAARIFHCEGGLPTIILAGEPRTVDAKANLRYAAAMGIPIRDGDEAWDSLCGWVDQSGPWDATVDALLGTGMSRAPRGRIRDLILMINRLSIPVVSADIPSGMDGETGSTPGDGVRADATVCFGSPKPGPFLSTQRDLAGEITVADIGIPPLLEREYLTAAELTPFSMLEDADLGFLLPKRFLSAHKGTAGRVMLYAGSPGMAGAAALAARACLRAGAGLVSLVCDPSLMPVFHGLVPEAVCVPLTQALQQAPAHDVFACGCGLGNSEEAWRNIRLLHRTETLSVWDADALNLLASHPMTLGPRAVMTPHPAEAARLLSEAVAGVTEQPVAAATELHRRYGATVVLKSHCPVVLTGPRVTISAAGTPVLAKGGSGDVLTGILAGLLAQLREAPDACHRAAETACLWHGLAGRIAQRRAGLRSALATDVIESMGQAAAFG